MKQIFSFEEMVPGKIYKILDSKRFESYMLFLHSSYIYDRKEYKFLSWSTIYSGDEVKYPDFIKHIPQTYSCFEVG